MAKLLLISDLHLRDTTPQGRIDDFQEAMWDKLGYVFYAAKDKGVDCILQAGDFFDKPKPSYSLVTRLISFCQCDLEQPSIPILCVMGQHDIYMRHSDIKGTALGLLDMVGEIALVSESSPYKVVSHHRGKECWIYGVNYGGDPNFTTKKNKVSILIIHADIGDKPLYPGHEYTDAEVFLKNHSNFDIILCGDYHYPFHIEKNGKHIVNTGCMLRMTRDKRDMNRKPHFYIVNTDTNKWEKYEIPHEPIDKVFSDKKELLEKPIIANEGDLIRFIQQLKQKGKSGIHYLDVLDAYCSKHEISEEIKELIREVLI